MVNFRVVPRLQREKVVWDEVRGVHVRLLNFDMAVAVLASYGVTHEMRDKLVTVGQFCGLADNHGL